MANSRPVLLPLRVPRSYRVVMADNSFWVVKASSRKTAIHNVAKLVAQAGTTGAAAQIVHAERTSWAN